MKPGLLQESIITEGYTITVLIGIHAFRKIDWNGEFDIQVIDMWMYSPEVLTQAMHRNDTKDVNSDIFSQLNWHNDIYRTNGASYCNGCIKNMFGFISKCISLFNPYFQMSHSSNSFTSMFKDGTVYPKNFHDSLDICPMGLIYSIQICEIPRQTFGLRKCPMWPMIFINTVECSRLHSSHA